MTKAPIRHRVQLILALSAGLWLLIFGAVEVLR